MAGESVWKQSGATPINVDVASYKEVGNLFSSFIKGAQKFTTDLGDAQKGANLDRLRASAKELTTEDQVRENKDLFNPESLRAKYGYNIDLGQAAAIEKSTLQTAIGEDTRLRGIGTEDYINQVGLTRLNAGEKNQGILRNVFDQNEATRVADAQAAEQEYIANSGKLFDINAAGQIIPREGTTPEQQRALSAQLREKGFGFGSNFGVEERAFKNYALTNRLTSAETAAGLQRLEQSFTDKKFTTAEQGKITAFNAKESTNLKGRLAYIKNEEAAALLQTPVDEALGSKARAKEDIAFNKMLAATSPDDRAFSNDIYGGAELLKEMAILRDDFPRLQAWEIEAQMGAVISGDKDGIFDVGYHMPELRERLKRYIATSGNYNDRMINRQGTIRANALARSEAATNASNARVASNQATWDASRGGANEGRNKKYKSGIGFAEAAVNVKNLKGTGRKNTKIPPTDEGKGLGKNNPAATDTGTDTDKELDKNKEKDLTVAEKSVITLKKLATQKATEEKAAKAKNEKIFGETSNNTYGNTGIPYSLGAGTVAQRDAIKAYVDKKAESYPAGLIPNEIIARKNRDSKEIREGIAKRNSKVFAVSKKLRGEAKTIAGLKKTIATLKARKLPNTPLKTSFIGSFFTGGKDISNAKENRKTKLNAFAKLLLQAEKDREALQKEYKSLVGTIKRETAENNIKNASKRLRDE